jgi:hypothetical protein
MSDQINDWTKRAQQYWYIDGLSEIGSGAVILSVGILYGIASLLPDESISALLQAIGLPVLVIGLAVLVRWIVSRLKQTITYPRTGYIAYRPPEPRRRISGILVAVATASGIALVVTVTGDWIDTRWIPAMTGLFVALLTVLIAFRIRLFRFFILAVFPLASGLALAISGVAAPINSALLFGSLGFGWIIAGVVTLGRYLRNTTPADLSLDESENG